MNVSVVDDNYVVDDKVDKGRDYTNSDCFSYRSYSVNQGVQLISVLVVIAH